jgi:DNA-binding NarL/FixJ family response regulator
MSNSNPNSKIKVVIAEDHAVVRQGLKILIHTNPELQVTGEAEDGVTAVRLAEEMQPDVVIMDLAMPNMNGYEATRQIRRKAPGCKVLVLSSYGDDDSVKAMLGAGAQGYITKHSASEDLLQAIRQVNSGETYLSPRIAERFRRLVTRNWVASGSAYAGARLSRRETQVLGLIARGLATKQIAEQLGLSVKTVEKHRQATMDKLDIHEIAGLTRYAESKGLIGSDATPSSAPGI